MCIQIPLNLNYDNVNDFLLKRNLDSPKFYTEKENM